MIPRGARSAASLVTALATGACTADHQSLLNPPACTAPVVLDATAVANPTNALSAFLVSNVRGADSVLVRFGAGANLDSVTPAIPVTDDSATAPVFGLLPATTYRLQVAALSGCAEATSATVQFTTAPLPSDLPAYSAKGADGAPGFVVFAAGKYGLAIDNTGRVVWYYRFPNGPGLNFEPQPDGRYTALPGATPGESATWVELAPDGTVARRLGCAQGLAPRMHDLIAQPDGSYWLMCDETRTLDLSSQGKSSQARVLGTDVQWVSSAGNLLFQWSPFDHFAVDLSVLAPADRDAAVINWTHGNALDLDRDSNVVVSFRNLSELTKIDTRTGAVVWRMGGKQNQFTFDSTDTPAFVGQHGLRVVGPGQLLLLDNLGDPVRSRAERYEIDEAHRTARLMGAYGASAGLLAQLGGSTQSLPGGHTLVSFGNGGGLAEYDQAGNAVWQLTGNTGYIFRATRIRSLYHPGVGDPR